MDKMPFYLFAMMLLSVFALIEPQCHDKKSCGECIQTHTCAWCVQPEFGDKPRCFVPDWRQPPEQCLEEYVISPDSEQMVIRWDSLGRGGPRNWRKWSGGSGSGRVVQISPQHVHLKLRINDEHSMSVKYARAEDYPIDLYYLMDLSKSMEADKEKLSNLGNKLAYMLKGLTSNIRLGFGSFDKASTSDASKTPQNVCEGCEAPYGFKNHMKLTANTEQFAENVKNAQVSGNSDAPEGGLDALMQAIVCQQEIGWREQARKLIVFATNAGYNYTGDGKLNVPNDGVCHMSGDMYTHSTVQDYPSISQINDKVNQNQVSVIFAVTAQQQAAYRNLSQYIDGSSNAVLADDSENVGYLVINEYSKITSSVEMKDSASGPVKVTYYSKCLGIKRRETNRCDGLRINDVVTFETEIVVTSCPADPKERKQTFQIYPDGVGEALTIDLEMICSCGCEKTPEKNSALCSGSGTLSCGACECEEGFVGRHCECPKKDSGLDINKCRRNNETDVLCSGQGNCVCGQCECEFRLNPEELITGEFCECDNFSCDRNIGFLCSGNGICDCGTCKCFDGYGGSACDCRTSIDTCKAPNGEICSGHGSCRCGICECEEKDEIKYSGPYCESVEG